MTARGSAPGSTRINIVERSLADSIERLSELPDGPRVRALRTKAQSFQRALEAWATRPPNEEQRATLLKLALELNLEVIAVSKQGASG